MEPKEEKKRRKASGWEVIVLALATLGAVELFNHAKAGPLREWWIDGSELKEAVLVLKEQMAQRGQLDKLPPSLAATATSTYRK